MILGNAHGHLFLYENIEINFHDANEVRVEFSIHAPELPLAVSADIDPAAVDDDWLRTLPDDDIARLCQEANTFIRENFLLLSGRENFLEKRPLRFESLSSIRNPGPSNALPAGCLLATVLIDARQTDRTLTVGFADSAQKRLMVAVGRPGAFPDVHDLAPGESVLLDLPLPPPEEPAPPSIESPTPVLSLPRE